MSMPLREWETFYVIVGSAAAALTGLQFVVIALTNSSSKRIGGVQQVEAFATPTVVHFCSVLTIAAVLSVPGHSAGSLFACLAILGAGGVVYSTITAMRARRQTGYEPVLEDWLWHAGFPLAAYGALVVTSLLARNRATGALYWIGGIALALLFIGIHNAWDAAVYISTRLNESDDE